MQWGGFNVSLTEVAGVRWGAQGGGGAGSGGGWGGCGGRGGAGCSRERQPALAESQKKFFYFRYCG